MRRSSPSPAPQTELPPPTDRAKTATFSNQERRTVFAHMVRAEFKSGALDGPRRRKLLRFAKDIDITPDQAETIIDDARNNLGLVEPDPIDYDAYRTLISARTVPARSTRFLILGAAILLADWLIIHTLFR